MATTSFSELWGRPTRFSQHWLTRLYKQWLLRLQLRLRARQRLALYACPLCSDDLQRQAQELLATGYHCAAVTVARVRLELTCKEYYHKVAKYLPNEHRLQLYKVSPRTVARKLSDAGFIPSGTARRVKKVYARGSNVVHGKPCSRHLAAGIVEATENVIAEMLGGESCQSE